MWAGGKPNITLIIFDDFGYGDGGDDGSNRGYRRPILPLADEGMAFLRSAKLYTPYDWNADAESGARGPERDRSPTSSGRLLARANARSNESTGMASLGAVTIIVMEVERQIFVQSSVMGNNRLSWKLREHCSD